MTDSMAPAPGVEVRDYLDWLRVECGSAAHTLAAYAADLALYVRGLRPRSPRTATRDDVREFVAREVERGMSAATQARRLVAVRTFHRWLFAEGRTADDPAAEVDLPGLWDRIPAYLPRDEVERFLAEPGDATPRSLRDQALVELLYACGLRASEVAGLRRDRVLFDEAVVRVRGKGGKDRIVPFGTRARVAVERWLADGRPAFAAGHEPAPVALLLTVRGRALTRQDVWRIVRERAAAAGITRKLSPHTLRHSFATHLLAGGADLRIVQALLGHASVSTTQIYTRVEEDRMRAAHAQFHPRG